MHSPGDCAEPRKTERAVRARPNPARRAKKTDRLRSVFLMQKSSCRCNCFFLSVQRAFLRVLDLRRGPCLAKGNILKKGGQAGELLQAQDLILIHAEVL